MPGRVTRSQRGAAGAHDTTTDPWAVIDPEIASVFLARLEDERRVAAGLREQLAQAAVLAFAQALEARCADTDGHSDRIARLSRTVALRMGMDAPTAEHVWLGGRLHDIGKVGVPDSILWKSGPLADGERRLMETHPAIGARMLAAASLAAEAVSIVHHHHERFDGSGYPHGVRGEEIPLGARIVAVVDAYDAMRSPRPYRSAMPRREALEQLGAGRGGQFDPGVVEVFLTLPLPAGEYAREEVGA